MAHITSKCKGVVGCEASGGRRESSPVHSLPTLRPREPKYYVTYVKGRMTIRRTLPEPV